MYAKRLMNNFFVKLVIKNVTCCELKQAHCIIKNGRQKRERERERGKQRKTGNEKRKNIKERKMTRN